MSLKDDFHEYALAFSKGDERVFAIFFNDLYPSLLYYAFRIVDNKGKAEEIVNDSFYKLWERRAGFNEYLTIKTWLYTTTRNACISLINKEKRETNNQKDLAADLDSRKEYLYDPIYQVEQADAIRNIIKILPEKCRKVFICRVVYGKSIEETAKELGIKTNTVKSHWKMAMKTIKKKYPYLSPFLWTFLFLKMMQYIS
jgi:RNA polymerase sigma-70 factor (ECF subfamily)